MTDTFQQPPISQPPPEKQQAAVPEPSPLVQGEQLFHRMRSGANWFYWIAGLSIVNSLLTLFEAKISFVVGLGITQLIDAFGQGLAQDMPSGLLPKLIAMGFSLVAAGVFVLFGWLANGRRGWAFLLGMALYAVDGLLFLLVRDWWGLGFHAFALFCIFGGYQALRQLRQLEQQAYATSQQ